MSQFESLADAAEALAAANAEGDAPTQETPGTSEQPIEQQTTEQVEATEGTTAESDSFTKVDLASLTDGLAPEAAQAVEAAYKSFQSDYTRKMQEASPYRKLADEFGGNLDDLRQSVEFVQNLRTDPDFAVRVHQELSSALQDAGLTEAEANEVAAQELADSDDFGEFDLEDPRDAALQELLEFKQELEAREEERRIEQQIQRAEMAIRQANPDYTDGDMDRIVQLAFAYGGDLFRAEKDFAAMREAWLSNYLDGKGSVESTTPVPTSPTPHAQQPESFETLDDAHKAARRHLAELLAN